MLPRPRDSERPLESVEPPEADGPLDLAFPFGLYLLLGNMSSETTTKTGLRLPLSLELTFSRIGFNSA